MDAGFRVQGSGFRVQGLGSMDEFYSKKKESPIYFSVIFDQYGTGQINPTYARLSFTQIL